MRGRMVNRRASGGIRNSVRYWNEVLQPDDRRVDTMELSDVARAGRKPLRDPVAQRSSLSYLGMARVLGFLRFEVIAASDERDREHDDDGRRPIHLDVSRYTCLGLALDGKWRRGIPCCGISPEQTS